MFTTDMPASTPRKLAEYRLWPMIDDSFGATRDGARFAECESQIGQLLPCSRNCEAIS